jgi:hypothetical protein
LIATMGVSSPSKSRISSPPLVAALAARRSAARAESAESAAAMARGD